MDDLTGGVPNNPSNGHAGIKVRHELPGDRNLIIASWLKCYRRHAFFTRNISNTIYYDWHQRIIKRLFSRGAVAHIAALQEDPVVILGYLITENDESNKHNPIVHFAFVKYPFRYSGVLRQLATSAKLDPSQPLFYTHHTNELTPIINKYPKCQFNPYLL